MTDSVPVGHGRLYYLMGASGSGKDTLLGALIELLLERHTQVRRVQRYITRAADAGGEYHRAVTEQQFRDLRDAGEFCMHWQAHGFSYGIHRETLGWLAAGEHVVLNGSRAYLAEARKVVPDLQPILVQVSASVQAERLKNRGRETRDEIAARLQRQVQLPDHEADMLTINNCLLYTSPSPRDS